MDYFNYKDNELYAEDLKVSSLVQEYGSPLYIYSKATLVRHMRAFEEALAGKKHLICYAVKANCNLSLLSLMKSLGAGFDVVSEGELRRVLKIGADPKKVIFSGVGKTRAELTLAVKSGIGCINVESEAELKLLSKICAELKCPAQVALRVNPDVDAKTHPSISTGLKGNKFGIAAEDAFALYQQVAADPYLQVSGIDCHIGSQMTSNGPIAEATEKLLSLYGKLEQAGILVDHIDIGGGLGVTYNDETPPSPYEYMAAVLKRVGGRDVSIYVEPGRAMVANAGILACSVLYLKQTATKNFCIVDAGMSDLIRPALYNSWMNIVECRKSNDPKILCDVVGPICESDDFLGRDRKLAVQQGDIIAVRGAGAYGMSMASNYNARRLPCEILVDGTAVEVIRRRQDFEDLWAQERQLAFDAEGKVLHP